MLNYEPRLFSKIDVTELRGTDRAIVAVVKALRKECEDLLIRLEDWMNERCVLPLNTEVRVVCSVARNRWDDVRIPTLHRLIVVRRRWRLHSRAVLKLQLPLLRRGGGRSCGWNVLAVWRLVVRVRRGVLCDRRMLLPLGTML